MMKVYHVQAIDPDTRHIVSSDRSESLYDAYHEARSYLGEYLHSEVRYVVYCEMADCVVLCNDQPMTATTKNSQNSLLMYRVIPFFFFLYSYIHMIQYRYYLFCQIPPRLNIHIPYILLYNMQRLYIMDTPCPTCRGHHLPDHTYYAIKVRYSYMCLDCSNFR